MNTDYFFKRGKVSFVMDGAAGSSGKSLLTSFLVEHSDKVNFLMSSFTPNASHTVSNDDGSEYVFKIFAGGSQFHERLEAVYIVDNSAIELETLWKEMEYLKIPREKVRISPRCAIVQQIDKDFEAGLCDFHGNYYSEDELGDGTILTGSTCSGSGAVLARKVVRNKLLKTAKDCPELKDMLYPMDEIVNRLDSGQCGLYEIAQGFPLSMNHHRFAPHTTSRNVTTSNALNDAMLPPSYCGHVFINLRTYPIKIHSKKYKDKVSGNFLTWEEVQSASPESYEVVESYSGDFYPDQHEMSWDEVTKMSGSPTKIMEVTTLTKLPRRIANFSKINLEEAVLFNNTGHRVFLSVNFMNYVVASISGKRSFEEMTKDEQDMIDKWLSENINETVHRLKFRGVNVSMKYIGTGKLVNDKILVKSPLASRR